MTLPLTVEWVQIAPHLLSGQQPVGLIRRGPGHEGKAWAGATAVGSTAEFWSPNGFVTDKTCPWAVTRTGDFVRVPVLAYRTRSRALASVLGLGLEIGLAACVSLRQHTGLVPQAGVLFLGDECTDLAPEDAMRCYVGVALRTK